MNAIVRKYGVPDVVRVELARDMKLTRKQKEEAERRNRQNKKERDIARESLKTVGISEPTHEDMLKYRLWRETGGICPYTGHSIGMNMLFTQKVRLILTT